MSPQFTNPYNTQNGMNPSGMGPNPYNGNPMGPMSNNQPGNAPIIQQPMTQTTIPNDWRPYSPGPTLPAFNGKWVRSFEDIRPNDVPPDGSFAFFPQEDKSCIYALVLNIDGRINSFRFIPEKIETEPPVQQNVSDPIKEFLTGFSSSINERISSLDNRIGDILDRLPVTEEPKSQPKKRVTKEGE